jgi:hypothetical protein
VILKGSRLRVSIGCVGARRGLFNVSRHGVVPPGRTTSAPIGAEKMVQGINVPSNSLPDCPSRREGIRALIAMLDTTALRR